MNRQAAFIFRRDLRLHDNLGLIRALAESEAVVPVFIFDPRQADAEKNEYFSERSFAFLCGALRELDRELREKGSRLVVCRGAPQEVLASLLSRDEIDAVYVNRDYTPFSRARDAELARTCAEAGVPFVSCEDIALSPIEKLRTGDGHLYAVFTPFMRKAMTHDVPRPRAAHGRFFAGSLQTGVEEIPASDIVARPAGLRLLTRLASLTAYASSRDRLGEDGTSRLSVHHKFGTVSIRETYWAAKNAGLDAQFVGELYWRDFYLYIARHFPHVFGRSFLPWGDYLRWENDEEQFRAWQEGKTGFPIVDAGMRQLKETGWMHNRARMIVASFLTKNLLIDWRWGEKHFAQHLIDYDPSSNNGGWQWSASVGADTRPLRIFNPYAQAQKYDSDATYIKTWVPELADVDSALLVDGKPRDFSALAPYPAPIIDYAMSYRRAQEAYREAKRTHRASQQ